MTPLAQAGFHHAQITVEDIERSRQFYAGFVGLKELPRPVGFAFPGAWFALANGQELHIVKVPDPLWKRSNKLEIYETHMALRVPSFRAALAHLEAHGYSESLPDGDALKMVVKLNSPTGYPQVYILDPDGHLIEFNAANYD